MAEKPGQVITGEQLIAGIDAAIQLLDAVRDVLRQHRDLRLEIPMRDFAVLAPAVGRRVCGGSCAWEETPEQAR